ncbi:MAG: hypothetical protein R3E01_20515 [Pirellulaceae bacterium]|nr:hypothetical protein [Planctomycetales bacterium]
MFLTRRHFLAALFASVLLLSGCNAIPNHYYSCGQPSAGGMQLPFNPICRHCGHKTSGPPADAGNLTFPPDSANTYHERIETLQKGIDLATDTNKSLSDDLKQCNRQLVDYRGRVEKCERDLKNTEQNLHAYQQQYEALVARMDREEDHRNDQLRNISSKLYQIILQQKTAMETANFETLPPPPNH